MAKEKSERAGWIWSGLEGETVQEMKSGERGPRWPGERELENKPVTTM